jgi:hypothetical protein
MFLFDRLIDLLRKKRFSGQWVCVRPGDEADDELLKLVSNSREPAECRITIRIHGFTDDEKRNLRLPETSSDQFRARFAEFSIDEKSWWDGDAEMLVCTLTTISDDPETWFRTTLPSIPRYGSDSSNWTEHVECTLRTC